MRVPLFLSFVITTALSLALVSLSGCSRESSVKENVNLKNNHSRVFAFNTPIEDPQAFADSMANTALMEADTIPDTLTVTINDTVYLIGLLPYNVDKIYRFQWTLTKANGKDTTIIGNNAKPQAWAYAKPGYYEPKFVAFDGNNATDTAGTATRKAIINVIDTKPTLVVPQDTLWTKHDGTITFPILVSDSFGTVTDILVDLDASGKKDSAKAWKFETFEDNDSLYISIKNDATKVDSLGNQKIYIIAIDDDGNETKDSVNLHFNRIPRLKVIYPMDGGRHNVADRFYFYYEGEDDDNPQDLQYFIYAQVSKNGQPPQKAFTEDDLIAENFTSNIFEPRNSKGENVITLINNPSKELTGRIYWDMYVTDGYDIVHLERISTGDKSSRPWSFYIGDLSSTQGTFTGVAKYQGRDNHEGIHVSFSNGNKTFDGYTDAKGNYTIKVDEGPYTATASSDSLREYQSVVQKDLLVEPGSIVKAEDMLLKDTANPVLLVKNIDTVTTRKFSQTLYARDLGSHLKSVTAAIDDTEKKLSCSIESDSTVFNCAISLDSLMDGPHTLSYTAQDKAGNKATLSQEITVKATSIDLTVNGTQKARISDTGTLTFNAVLTGAFPAPKNVTWEWDIEGNASSEKGTVENGAATLELTFDKLAGAQGGKDYIMTVSYTENGANVQDQVKFGILDNNPAVIFTEPGLGTTLSINDPLNFKLQTYMGLGSSVLTLSWNCDAGLSDGYTCPTTETDAILAFKTTGEHKIIATAVDDQSLSGSDTVIVTIVPDPPSISAESDGSTYKINTVVPVKVSATDKFGTVNQIQWGCSNGKVSFDFDTTFATPRKALSDVPLQVQLPGAETDNYRCIFKAIDDDGEEGMDTLTFKTLLDLPTVTLNTQRDTVKINSNQPIKANATDQLGYIAQYDIACSDNLSELKNPAWDLMSGSETVVRMPSTATNAYYCVVQVTDDDGNTARDTATYKVIVGLPTVAAYSNYNKVTIKDVVELNAHAQDSLGSIVKYEWGCGSASAENIGFTYSSSTTPSTTMTMPSTAQNGYRCIARVTDDDGNTAKDTVTIDIILAPPTVTVEKDELVVREGFNIALSATASDNNNVPSDPGSIVKREWSCGTPEQIDSKWKTVSSYDTVWKAPAPQVVYYCIARATDNDGNTANDTIDITFTTDIPIIRVKDDVIYVNPGDAFSLDASVNSAWQGIDWFTWECKDKSTGKTMEKSVPKYDYIKNGKSFSIGKDSTYSEKGKDMYCIISAQETSGKDVLSDTTEVRILQYHPQGVITAADTVYLWSGDEAVNNEALYFYTSEWGGFNSVMGELGNEKAQDYWWRFSNVDGNFYQGNKDGSLDTSIAEFNAAFIRKTHEGSMTIYLDYRDSTTSSPSISFYNRHRAEEVSRKVYFRKAWQNQSADTIVAASTMNTPPVMTLVNDKPIVAYLESKNKVTVTGLKGGTWKSIASVTTTDSVTTLRLVTNGTDLFLGVLESSGQFSLYKSAGSTSAFASMGTPLTDLLTAQIVIRESELPYVVALNSTDRKIYLYEYDGSDWAQNTNFGVFYGSENFREVDAVFNDDGQLAVVGVNNSYTAYYGFYSPQFKLIRYNGFSATDVSKITLATSGSEIYMGFLSRNVETYGPYVFQGSFRSNEIYWDKTGLVKKPLYEGYIAYHISLAIHNGTLFAAIDDNGRATLSQVHVFRYENGKWHFHGENQLPYFSTVFYDDNKYYLRGSCPMLAVDGSGKIYLSMLARENAGGNKLYNGPLVMKYVADNWEIH